MVRNNIKVFFFIFILIYYSYLTNILLQLCITEVICTPRETIVIKLIWFYQLLFK